MRFIDYLLDTTYHIDYKNDINTIKKKDWALFFVSTSGSVLDKIYCEKCDLDDSESDLSIVLFYLGVGS